jgi:hypothetical protein
MVLMIGEEFEIKVFFCAMQDSPVFSYICNLSPIKTIKPIPITCPLSSLNYASPPSVFTSPHAVSHKESRFRSQKDVSASKEVGEEEALVGSEPEQSYKNDCNTPRVTNDVKDNGCGKDLQVMMDNVKKKSDTPDWETLIAATTELIYGSPRESEAFSCLLKKTSNSEARLRGSITATSVAVTNTDVVNNESESVDALSILHRGVRRRCLDFEVKGNNQQTLGESSSSCVVPSIGLHLNTIAMSSKDKNVANEYSFSGNIKVGVQSSLTPVLHSQHDIVRENESGKDSGQIIEVVPKSLASVDLTPISPKKKRRKSEQSGEGDSSCKRCNCKKSKCLKL